MVSRVTFSKILMWVGLSAGIVLFILGCIVDISGTARLRFFDYPYTLIILLVYIIGIASKKVWGFYVATIGLATWAILWVEVRVQHLRLFLDQPGSLPFRVLKERLFQEVGGVSILVLLSGLVATRIFLKATGAAKLSDIERQEPRDKTNSIMHWMVIVGIIALLAGVLMPVRSRPRQPAKSLICGTHVCGLGTAIQVYAERNDGQYPTPEKWCDLLIEDVLVTEAQFVCPGAPRGPCNYAINPNCQPGSARDLVLLFEAKPGWNQAGGPELLTTANHKDEGAFVCFADLSVKFVRTDELARLKWK
ncbi:MAG TPA: hypothetical protein VMX13_06215 [Sedimentisphaerales bacterium]|nr:hypothetical protein [Sedimentisphaerales bacterium]